MAEQVVTSTTAQTVVLVRCAEEVIQLVGYYD